MKKFIKFDQAPVILRITGSSIVDCNTFGTNTLLEFMMLSNFRGSNIVHDVLLFMN